jgi:MoaA/NifB/PqqE/SkfB family radical SAM enzyme
MTFEKFRVIGDKIRPFVEYLYLHNWGEPFLNKDLFRIIKFASGFVRTNISTNAQLITQTSARNLIRSGVSDILVSIDGMSPEAYARYRRGGNLDKALDALKWLAYYGKRYRLSLARMLRLLRSRIDLSRVAVNPTILPQFIVFQHNEHEMQAFESFCRSLGLTPSFKAPYLRNDSGFCKASDVEYHRPEYPDPAHLRRAMTECSAARGDFTILLDGSVVGCCYDHDGTHVFGNVFEQDVLEIWNSPDYRAFRKAVLTGAAPEFCIKNCLLYTLRSNCDAENK